MTTFLLSQDTFKNTTDSLNTNRPHMDTLVRA